MNVSIIVAMSTNQVIGINNRLPWHLPADLTHFKSITMSNPVIMGRKTFDSIGKPLPGRQNIVLSRSGKFLSECAQKDCHIVQSLEEAFALVQSANEVFIIGGAQLFALVLPITQRIYCTWVNHLCEGDTYFPNFNIDEWQEINRIDHKADEKNSYPYSFVILERTMNR